MPLKRRNDKNIIEKPATPVIEKAVKKNNVTDISNKQAKYMKEILGGKLDPKEEVFCREFAITLDMGDAYIKAYHSTTPNYSKAIANNAASAKMLDPKIQKAIKKHIDARHERLQITGDKVLSELSCIAFSNVKDMYEFEKDANNEFVLDDSGRKMVRFKSLLDMPDIITRAIQEVKYVNGGCIVKLYNKHTALTEIGNYMGLFDADSVKDVREVARQIKQALEEIDNCTRAVPEEFDKAESN